MTLPPPTITRFILAQELHAIWRKGVQELSNSGIPYPEWQHLSLGVQAIWLAIADKAEEEK